MTCVQIVSHGVSGYFSLHPSSGCIVYSLLPTFCPLRSSAVQNAYKVSPEGGPVEDALGLPALLFDNPASQEDRLH